MRGGVTGLLRGDTGGIHTAHLAGADADGAAVRGKDDGVRFHMLADPPGEQHVVDLACVRGGACHDGQIVGADRAIVA